jgi:hypothetical protein
MEFIKYLPPQLEELYLWIHGYDLCLDDLEDFEPVRQLAVPIFSTLHSLHSCDILAFISNIDGGLCMGHPENSVHYRRLPHQGKAGEVPKQSNIIKDIWVSTMDSIYQEDYPVIGHKLVTLELEDGDGFYEGHDAEEIWMGGGTKFHGGDKTWPGQKVYRPWRYPMYEQAGTGGRGFP